MDRETDYLQEMFSKIWVYPLIFTIKAETIDYIFEK